jgi:transcription antitermination factor NusA-like protein
MQVFPQAVLSVPRQNHVILLFLLEDVIFREVPQEKIVIKLVVRMPRTRAKEAVVSIQERIFAVGKQ